MPDPSYPCNRQFVSAADGTRGAGADHGGRALPAQRRHRWRAHWKPGRTRGVLLASPSNPTGTSIHPDELRRIHALVAERGGITIVDEIYLGLGFDAQYGHSALAIDDSGHQHQQLQQVLQHDRLAPGLAGRARRRWCRSIERLAQNLFICPSTIAQHAALACFEADSIAEYERRRDAFQAAPRLPGAGARTRSACKVPVMPDGAFYAWADCTQACARLGVADSWDLAFALMQQAHVAVTPGRDFGQAETARFIRFSSASSMAQLQTAVARLQTLLG